MKRLNIFDFDGTLAYTLLPLYHVYKDAFRELANVALTKDVWMKYYGKNFPDILVGEYNIFDKELFEEIHMYKYERYPQNYFSIITMNNALLNDAIPINERYELKDTTNIICTLTKKEVVSSILEYFGMRDMFSAIYDRDDVLYKKPAPDIYIKAISDWYIHAKEKVDHIHIYEDSQIGLTSATNAVNELIHFLSDAHVSIHKIPEEKL